MNRYLTAPAITAIAALTLMGCGGSDEPAATTTTPPASAPCPAPGEVVTESINNGCTTPEGQLTVAVITDYGDCQIAAWEGGWGRIGEPAQAGDPTLGDDGPCPTPTP